MSNPRLERLQQQLWSFAEHRVITVAGRTGILARLARGEGSAPELAEELGLDPAATGKVIRALVALELAEVRGERGGEARYALRPELAPHFDPEGANLLPFLEHSHQMYNRWGESLEPWLRGESWTTQRRGPPAVERFGEAMEAMGSQVAEALAERIDLRGVERVLDVGGGFGQYSRALCHKSPELRATVLDMPEVAELGQKRLEGSPLAGRVEFVGGNYHERELEPVYDLAILANILHQEQPERAAVLVERVAGALRPGGRLAVVDFSIDPDGCGPRLGALFAINMRSFGDTHGEARIRGWLKRAGLEQTHRIDLSPDRWLIQGTKP